MKKSKFRVKMLGGRMAYGSYYHEVVIVGGKHGRAKFKVQAVGGEAESQDAKARRKEREED